jgi:hypothetical protein
MIPHHIKKKRLSWTGFNLYWNNPEDYFERYVLRVPQKISNAMKLGSIFQKAFTDRTFNYQQELMENKLGGKNVDIIENALKVMPDIGKKNCEIEIVVPFYKLSLLGIFDGYLSKSYQIIENKFSGWQWTQQDADDNLQITFYSLVHFLKFKVPPLKITLNHICSKTGEVKSFNTKRSVKQLKDFEKNVKYAIDGILIGDWTKKI